MVVLSKNSDSEHEEKEKEERERERKGREQNKRAITGAAYCLSVFVHVQVCLGEVGGGGTLYTKW